MSAQNPSSVDVDAYATLDVLETKSGSVYKGIIADQDADKIVIVLAGGLVREVKTDDVAALSKEPNPSYRHAQPTTSGASSEAPIIAGSAPGHADSGDLPPALARSGIQIQPELAILFARGDIDDYSTSFGPTVRLGYEAVYGHLGLGGGVHLRYASWDIPSESDHHTTTEAHIYGRAGMHIGRTVLYAGVSLGMDVNHVYNNYIGYDETATDFGLNFQGGVEIGVSKGLALRFAFDYHPPTDTIVENQDRSVEYFGLLLGANIRL